MSANEQSMEALRRANYIRTTRSQIRKQIHAGERSAQSIILYPPPEMHTASISNVLSAVHRAGAKKVKVVCLRAKVSETTQLGNLTFNQQTRIVNEMETYSCFRK